MDADRDDRELIEGTLGGRLQDFEVLVERHQKTLHAYVLRMLRDPAAAEEVVHEAFVRAYSHLARFRGGASFKTWLHQIAINECRNRFRAARRRAEVALDDVAESELFELADEGDAGERQALHAGLERRIAELPPRQRSVLNLRVFSDLPFKEIARLEGITENSAKVSYHHAVMKLKQWLRFEK
jgi:RNA polymerase sigma-70 factor (ECF subfamily)